MVVLAVCSAFTMAVLAVGILGSDTTGLEGDWLLGNVVLGGEIYLATVGLAAVSLRNQRGTHSYRLLQLCGEAGGVDSVWCRLDTAGADAETMLTLAFVPAIGVIGLSLLTMLQNWFVVGNQGHRPEASGEPTGCFSVVHRFVMLVLWLALWAMTTSGLCIYAYQAPPTLGIGSVTSGKSYCLVRATVLYASIGSVALLARFLSLWDTRTAQLFLRDMLEVFRRSARTSQPRSPAAGPSQQRERQQSALRTPPFPGSASRELPLSSSVNFSLATSCARHRLASSSSTSTGYLLCRWRYT